MASITRRPDGKWRARYRDAARQEHSRHFDRKVDAQAWLNEINASVLTGRYVNPKAGKITLKAYATTWEANQVQGDAQTRLTDNALRLHILPKLGARPLETLRHSDVQNLIKGWSEAPLAAGTIRNHYGVLTRLLADAVADRLLAESPCTDRIKLPSPSDEEIVIPTEEEIAQLVGEFTGPRLARYRALPLLLVGTGLRIGELLGLQAPEDVVMIRREIHVRRQMLQSGALGPPKTDMSRRTVRMAPALKDMLAEHLAQFPAHPDGYLFSTASGAPLSYRSWRTVWTNARANCGLEHISNHDLRHTYASALISGGASVKQVQLALGHESPAITLRIYTHLWPGDEDRTADIIEAKLGDILRTRCGPGDLETGSAAGQSPG